nr:SDR family oxidoreductase [Ramlibacter aurantiacus]
MVFITGASSGIGQALAQRYAAAGWRLALVARRSAEMQAWAERLPLETGRFAVYGADVTSTDSIVAAGRACLAMQGLPDIVIGNAGISLGVDTSRREDLDVMALSFATNVLGLAATFQPFIAPMVRRQRGTLVGIGSVGGVRGLPGHGAYCASKAAAISYCESLRNELKAAGVRVVTISPGWVATPLTQRNRYPMPFLLQPAELADRAFRAIEAGASHRIIPWQMGLAARVLRVLPNAVFDRLVEGRPRKHRATDA